jgi:two-component system cell cycle sensor histidine kinase/response regulator CckA
MTVAKILIVEDEGVVALDLEGRLKRMGYSVSGIAYSGEEAIQKAAVTRPDLVLMDIRLRGRMDGIETAKKIQKHLEIPVVYLTALTDGETMRRARMTEPFGFLAKPFGEEELGTAIEMALYRRKMERRLKKNGEWLTTTIKRASYGVIVTNDRGRVKSMNRRAETLTGWRQEEASGRELVEVFTLVDEETWAPTENLVPRVLREGDVVDLDDHILLVARGGTETPLIAKAAPVKDDRGKVNGVLVVFQSIVGADEWERERRGR